VGAINTSGALKVFEEDGSIPLFLAFPLKPKAI
jgi:hypothetical protein